MRLRLCLLGALLASGLHSGQAQTPDTFSLEYAAPATCPDKASFVAAIVARAPGAREVDPGSAHFRFVAHLEPAGTSETLARGYISVEQEGQSPSVRDVTEAPCTEIVESMAVILSLIVAGNESAAAAAPAAIAAELPAAAAAVPAAPAPTPVAAPTATAAAPVAPTPPASPPAAKKQRPAPPESPAELDAAAPPESSAERLRVGMRLAALAETAVAPSSAIGAQGGFDVWWARHDWWSPSARLTGRYVVSPVERTDVGSARFRLAALRAELCPARWPTDSRTFGRLCGIFDAGQLAAEPEEDSVEGQTQNQTMPWLGAGGSLRVETTLAHTISLEAAADLVGLARADRFTFEPGSHTVHQVPRVSAMFSLGAVLRSP